MASAVKDALKYANNVGTAMIANTAHQPRLQQAMEKFHQILTPEEFSKLSNTPPDARSVLDLAEAVDGRAKKRKLRRWASAFGPFLESVQRYSLAVEILISSNPQIAALVWGSVKAVIIMALDLARFFEKLAEMFRAIGCVCPILKGFQENFSESPELRESMSEFYAVVVEFCTESFQFLKKNSTQQFTGLLGREPFDFQKFEPQLREQQHTIILQQALASEKATYNSRLQMSLFQTTGEQHPSNEIVHWAENDEKEIQMAMNEKKRVREELLERLSDYNYKSSFSEACRKRYEGTGQWLFDAPEFQAWIEADVSCGLWVHGIPGCGKTVLAAGVVEHLYSLPRMTKISTEMSISYFFCTFNDPRSRKPQTILSSLTRQILNIFEETGEIGEHLKLMFVTDHRAREPNIKELSALFTSVTRLPAVAYLVIDGLDECEDSDRREILSCLSVLIRQDPYRIKVIILSRWMDSELLEDFGQISIQSASNCSDIELYIREVIDKKINERSIVIKESSIAEEIKQGLIQKSDGMFLLAAFQILEISRENTDEGIRTVLGSLPTVLHEIYARILERIEKNRKPDVARRIFQWLAVARRPLSLDELAESTALEPGRFFWDESHRPTSLLRLIENCGNLVTHRTEDNIVQFAHSTILEFLLCSPANTPTPGLFFTKLEANLYVAKVCLAFLSFPDFEKPVSSIPPPPSDTLGRKFILLEYVSTQWIYHCAKLRQDDESHWRIFGDLIFSRQPPFPHLPWGPGEILSMDPSCEEYCWFNFKQLLHWAAENGHQSLFNLVISTMKARNIPVKPLISNQGGWVSILLVVASWQGDEGLVAIIVSEDGGVNGQLDVKSNRTALQAAAEGGHLAVINRLLSSNADVNAESAETNGLTALQAAARGGHLAVVNRLLSSNADVNAKPAEYFGVTALQAAAGAGHLAVVDRLLSSNADVNAKPTNYSGVTALQAAAGAGHLAVVDRLLSFNADVNANPAEMNGLTALQAAAGGGHLAVVNRLLSSNADANAKPAKYSGVTALQAAAGAGRLAVVDRLLSSDADVNAKPAEYSGVTALQAAAGAGHLAVVDRLLSSNADVGAGDSGVTALQAAAGGGHLAVVNRLLSSNADVNAEPAETNGLTALQAAARGGHLAVVNRLLSSNADVNAKPAEYFGITALQGAAGAGHLAVVDRLLSSNADVNAKDSGVTALQAAAGRGHLAVVDLLQKAGGYRSRTTRILRNDHSESGPW